MRLLLLRFGRWLNARLNIIASDEDSLYYDWADQSLDGLTTLGYDEWVKQHTAAIERMKESK